LKPVIIHHGDFFATVSLINWRDLHPVVSGELDERFRIDDPAAITSPPWIRLAKHHRSC
jgi:hypothetical protein